MIEYRTGAHAVYEIKYHLIWITKYRYRLRGRIAGPDRSSATVGTLALAL